MASVVHPASAVELEAESSPGGQSRGQDVRLLQPEKALSPMLVTEAGITTEVRLLQREKA